MPERKIVERTLAEIDATTPDSAASLFAQLRGEFDAATSAVVDDASWKILRDAWLGRKSGVLSRHRHPQPVHGYVIKGRWRYLEHDWVAQDGGYVYEAPGETHTLVVDEGVEEMITLFQVNGVMIYVDPDGAVLGYEDVFTKINLCRAHYEKVGLGVDYVDQFIR